LWASDEARVYTYPELGYAALGPVAKLVVQIVIVVDLFGALTAFFIVISDSTLPFIENHVEPSFFLLDRRVLMAFSIILIFPLTLLPKISWLGFTSFLSLIPVVYLLILQISYFSVEGIVDGPIPYVESNFFLALPIINFAFSSQISFFTIYYELRQRGGSSRDMSLVGRFTSIVSGVIYGACGLIGVLAYPTNTEGNIMLNFKPDVAIDILLVSMAIAVLFGYPVTLFVLRELIDGVLFPRFQFSYIRFGIEALVIIGLSYTIAVLIPSFTAILGIFGSITKVAVCQVFPALFYLCIGKGHWKVDKRKWVALFLMIVGGIAGIVSAIVTIINYVKKTTSPNLG